MAAHSTMDIIIPEVFVKKVFFGEETNKGKVVGVVTALGESLPVGEYEFAQYRQNRILERSDT